MMFSSNGNHGDDFHSSFSDDLLSLLLLPNTSPITDGTSTSYFRHSPSFYLPFDDPGMEPLPIRSHNVISNYRSPLDDLVQMEDPPRFTARDHQERSMDLVGSKRRVEGNFVDQDYGPSLSKRLRTSHLPSEDDEIAALRFKPSQEKQWRGQLQKLIEYKLKHGHCCVPHSYPEDSILARWVKRQRCQYKKFNDGDATSTMTELRIQELESIGFVWHSHASAWYERFNELKAFKQYKGHCNVPSHYPQNLSLSTWVKCQRRQYKLFLEGKTSGMTTERVKKLDSLGFVFNGRLQQASKNIVVA